MMFEELDLLHPPLDFGFIFWDGVQLESSFSGRILNLIENVLNIGHGFECKGSSLGLFFLCKFWGSFHRWKATI